MTKYGGLIDFSARQHGDGMKSPAAEGFERAPEAVEAGHPEEDFLGSPDKKISRE